MKLATSIRANLDADLATPLVVTLIFAFRMKDDRIAVLEFGS